MSSKNEIAYVVGLRHQLLFCAMQRRDYKQYICLYFSIHLEYVVRRKCNKSQDELKEHSSRC